MKLRWQFSLGTLFLLTTIVAAITAVLVQGRSWWLLAGLVIGQALLFCVIAGGGQLEEHQQSNTQRQQPKDISE